MFIKYNPKDPHVKTIPVVVKSSGGQAVPLAADSVIIRPGTNELTEEQWKAIKPHLQDEIDKKIIVPFTVPVNKAGSVKKAGTLKDVPVSVARKIIDSCQNVADLKKWGKQELPDEVLLLVLKRLRKFKVDPDELVDGETDGEDDMLDADITPEGSDDGDTDDEPTTPRRSHKKSGGVKGEGGNTETTVDTEPPEDGDPEDGSDVETDGEDEDEIPDFDGSRGRE
jgi:hypothetical protein